MKIRTLVCSRYRSHQLHIPGLYRLRTYPKTNRVIGLYQNHLQTYTICYAYNRLMLIWISRRSFRAYSYTKVPVDTTQIHYTEVPIGTTRLILILQDLYLFYRHGSTRGYYRTYTYFTDTRLPVGTTEQIQRYIQIFTLILYLVFYHMSV